MDGTLKGLGDKLLSKATRDLKELERQVAPMLKKELSKRAKRRKEERKTK